MSDHLSSATGRHPRPGTAPNGLKTRVPRARAKIEAWRIDYNRRRPHSSFGNLTPNEFARNRLEELTSEGKTIKPCATESGGTSVRQVGSWKISEIDNETVWMDGDPQGRAAARNKRRK